MLVGGMVAESLGTLSDQSTREVRSPWGGETRRLFSVETTTHLPTQTSKERMLLPGPVLFVLLRLPEVHDNGGRPFKVKVLRKGEAAPGKVWVYLGYHLCTILKWPQIFMNELEPPQKWLDMLEIKQKATCPSLGKESLLNSQCVNINIQDSWFAFGVLVKLP